MAMKTKQELIDRLRELEGKKGAGKAQLQDISLILGDLIETTFGLLEEQGQGGEAYTAGAFLESTSQPEAVVGAESTATSTPSPDLVLTGVGSGNGIYGKNAQGLNEFSIEHIHEATGANGEVVHELRHQSTGDISFCAGGFNPPEMLRVTGNGSVVTNSLRVSVNNVSGAGVLLGKNAVVDFEGEESQPGGDITVKDGYCAMRFSQGVQVFNSMRGGTPTIKLGTDGKVEAMKVEAKDTLLVRNDGNADKGVHAELYTEFGSDTRAVSLRFHQGNRWWHKITVNNNGFHFVDGTDFSYDYRDIYARTISALGSLTVGNEIGIQGQSQRLTKGAYTSIRIQTDNGLLDLGPMNTGWCHLQTDRPQFYFNRSVHIDGGGISSYGTTRISFQVEGVEKATVNSNGDFTSYGNITAFSDARLKSNVKAFEGGLEKVLSLRPVTYDRTDRDSKDEVGFIAQEVREVEPTLVLGDEENGHLSLDYSRMVVLLTKALQEQQLQIEKLNQKLELLESEKQA